MNTTTLAPTFRAIFTCRNRDCKHTWALEYRDEYTTRYGTKDGTRELKQGESEYIGDKHNGYRRSYSDDLNVALRCPECGCNLPKGGQVQGHYSEGHKCSAKCIGAKGPTCECECGGKNHGVSYL